jgi:hypothetical protein
MVEFTFLGILSSSFNEVGEQKRSIGDRPTEVPLESH